MVKCKFCELECKNIVGLIRHNKFAHGKTTKECQEIYKELYPKKEITPDMIQCKICGEYSLPLGMASHLNRKHGISGKNYYDTYCKKDDEGICKVCGINPTTFESIADGYRPYCSSKCANLDPSVQQKLKDTFKAKYGVEHPLKSEEIKAKSKQTSLEKYGVECALQLDRVREKSKEAIRSKEVVEKRKATNRERYGADMPFGSKEIQDKVKQTHLKKYGAENVYASDYSRHKIRVTKQSKLTKFCEDNKCVAVKNLELEFPSLCIDKSGVDTFTYGNSKLVYIKDIDKLKQTEKEILEANHTHQSSGEKAVYEFIKSIYDGKIIQRTRKVITPLELDLYIPDKKVAIEFNGSWWHSTNAGTENSYHLNKTLRCDAIGIQLIHIFEFEWQNNPELCKSIIASTLGIHKTIIDVKDCICAEVSDIEASKFLAINCENNFVNSTKNLGLYYNNELVQLICIKEFNKNEAELVRICTKLHTQIIGGFNTLIDKANYSKITFSIDRSKFDIDKFDEDKFKVIAQTKPAYVYCKGNIVLTKAEVKKHKLSKILGDKYDPAKTEQENMADDNWLQIYDCGTLKIEYIKS